MRKIRHGTGDLSTTHNVVAVDHLRAQHKSTIRFADDRPCCITSIVIGILLLISIAPLAVFVEARTALAECYCQGCGCKGGPGWRDPSGRCVSHKQLYKICGRPPGYPCRFEGATQVCPSQRST